MSRRSRKGKAPSRASGGNLLGDLDSIRTLLDEEEKQTRTADEQPTPDAEEVPVLQDVVDGALQVDESPLTGRAALSTDGTAALGDDTIKALLGDQWKENAAEIIANARNAVAADGTEWSPEQTDELGKVLKARLDGIVNIWLSRIVADGIDDLRSQLINAMEAEVTSRIEGLKDPDGS